MDADWASMEIEFERNRGFASFPKHPLEGYCPLCSSDLEGRFKYFGFLKCHLKDVHEVDSDEDLHLQMNLRLSVLQTEEPPQLQPTGLNPGVLWKDLRPEDKEWITESNKKEKVVTPEGFAELTAESNTKVFWMVRRDEVSPSLLKLTSSKSYVPSPSLVGQFLPWINDYFCKREGQSDLEILPIAWLAFTFVGNKCQEVQVRLDYIYVEKVYRGNQYGRALFQDLRRAYDGIYIEALYASV